MAVGPLIFVQRKALEFIFAVSMEKITELHRGDVIFDTRKYADSKLHYTFLRSDVLFERTNLQGCCLLHSTAAAATDRPEPAATNRRTRVYIYYRYTTKNI